MIRFALVSAASAIALGAMTIGASSPVSAQRQQLEINVDLIQGGGVCGASYRLGDNRKVQIRINNESGFVDVVVQNMPPEVVEAGKGRRDVAITLIFNGETRMTTQVGVLQAGFSYRAQGYWEDEDTGIEAIARLKDIRTLAVEVDGVNYGVATSKPGPDLGYNYIVNCLG